MSKAQFETLLDNSSVVLHNVQLVDVKPAPDDTTLIIVELNGETTSLPSPNKWSEEWSRRDVGRVGLVRHARQIHASGFYFNAYIEPSLRRAPELDLLDARPQADGRLISVIGWRCEQKPNGFRAPLGLIPGKEGNFIADETETVTLRVPPEFILECRLVQSDPKTILENFIADLSGIMNWAHTPRADHYSSNGSDERMFAEQWLQRTHFGMDKIALDDLEAADEEKREQEDIRDELADCMADFTDSGGTTNEFLLFVNEMVAKRQREAEHGADAPK